MPNTIFLLFDDASRPNAQQLASRIGARALHIREATSELLSRRRTIVADLDLGVLESVGLLRAALRADRPDDRNFLVGVESGSRAHATRAQAAALGATTMLRRPLHEAELRTALSQLGVPLPGPTPAGLAGAPGGASIVAAGKVLDQAFKTIASGNPLDVRDAISAGRELLAGVGSAGLSAWLDTVRGHHEGTFQHCLLVTGAAVGYARHTGMAERDQLTLIVAALLHDIGKAEMPLEILDKPGKLTDAEFAVIKTHPRIAEHYLAGQSAVPAEIVAAIAHHHEYLDGSGYPDRLVGDQITPLTRILTVCDIYGALVERRAYKEPKSPAQAVLILVDMARLGKLDYNVVRQFGLTVGEILPARAPYLA